MNVIKHVIFVFDFILFFQLLGLLYPLFFFFLLLCLILYNRGHFFLDFDFIFRLSTNIVVEVILHEKYVIFDGLVLIERKHACVILLH